MGSRLTAKEGFLEAGRVFPPFHAERPSRTERRLRAAEAHSACKDEVA
jgi:hypothetical protein